MWTTEDELDYIKRIGNHSETSQLRTTSRKVQLLRNYIRAAQMRSRWGGIDSLRVIGAARRHLAALESEIGQ